MHPRGGAGPSVEALEVGVGASRYLRSLCRGSCSQNLSPQHPRGQSGLRLSLGVGAPSLAGNLFSCGML